jgi:tRNA1Val (adenine37-N6)-methyltransferase
MGSNYFRFKQFTINQDKCAFKVGTDGVLLGASADITGTGRILDVGAGTGLISLMLAQRGGTHIFAIEPEKESFIQLCENINNSPWSNIIQANETSLQDFAPDMKFDLIVSNPPYFSDSLRNPDQRKSVTRHTDTLSSSDLLAGAERLLSGSGRFQVIMPYVEGNLLIAVACGFGLFCNSLVKIRPLPSSETKRIIITFTRERKPVHEKFLTIESGKRHDFTDDYIRLTRDFYLNF